MKEIKDIKCQTKYFYLVADKRKRFEIRKNDRDYRMGDILALKHYENDQYQGRFILVHVDYVLSDFVGLANGYVALTINNLSDVIYDNCGIFKGDYNG